MVPDDSLTIRERAIAAWPPAWHGQNLRDILVTLGYDVDTPVARPAEEGPRLDPLHRRAADRAGLRRLHAGRDARALKRKESRATWAPSPARALRAAHLRHDAERADEEARRARYMVSTDCPLCDGKRLRARRCR
jgi:excinuclease ABC subunit A